GVYYRTYRSGRWVVALAWWKTAQFGSRLSRRSTSRALGATESGECTSPLADLGGRSHRRGCCQAAVTGVTAEKPLSLVVLPPRAASLSTNWSPCRRCGPFAPVRSNGRCPHYQCNNHR